MENQRRRFGNWKLYTRETIYLGCKPYGTSFVYNVPVKDCQTQEGYENWVKHLQERNGDYDIPGFQLAINTLRAEGKYLKPL